jgi:hypothetical protein
MVLGAPVPHAFEVKLLFFGEKLGLAQLLDLAGNILRLMFLEVELLREVLAALQAAHGIRFHKSMLI